MAHNSQIREILGEAVSVLMDLAAATKLHTRRWGCTGLCRARSVLVVVVSFVSGASGQEAPIFFGKLSTHTYHYTLWSYCVSAHNLYPAYYFY